MRARRPREGERQRHEGALRPGQPSVEDRRAGGRLQGSGRAQCGGEFGEPASDRGRIQGDVENGVLPTGQSVGLIHEVKTAGDVVRDVVAEAEAALKRITL